MNRPKPLPAGDVPEAAIRLEGLGKRFGEQQALCGVNLSIAPGEFVSVIGPSGCGKTTLLRILAGLVPATEGTVVIEGEPVAEARRRQEIGIAFQRAALLPWRTALGNVQLTLEICRRPAAFDPQRLLRDFGLGDFMGHYPHQLSGGMQQRVSIAAAIVHHPRLLLLDEPFGALDELTREALWEWLAKLLAVTRQSAVLVTHSVEEAVVLSDRVVILSARPGRIHDVLTVDLSRPRTHRLDEAFTREVVRVRSALYAAIEGGEAPR
jgi:NitT/TauT family transport system ATP-binding protein